MIAAGMFLVATLGFVGVSIDRQRKQRAAKVTRRPPRVPAVPRRRPQGGPRGRRPAAPELLWHHPDPRALPGARRGPHPAVGAHAATTPSTSTSATACTSQPLALELVPPETRPDRAGRPGGGVRAAPAARRAPGAARPARRARPARVRPRSRSAAEDDGPRRWPGRWSARPRRSTPPRTSWSPCSPPTTRSRSGTGSSGCRTRRAPRRPTPSGPSRMVTDLARRPGGDAAAATSSTGRASAPTSAPPPRTSCSGRRRQPAARQPPHPRRGRARRDRARPARALGRARRPDPAAAATSSRSRCPTARPPSPRCGCARGHPGAGRPARPGQRRGVRPPARAAAHRRGGRCREDSLAGTPDLTELLGARRRAHLRPRRRPGSPTGPRPAAGAGRRRRRRRAGLPRHQGVRPAGHGPARPGHRRDRLRQVGVPAHAGARPGDDALVRGAQHGARRLQGRRDLRRAVAGCRTSRR